MFRYKLETTRWSLPYVRVSDNADMGPLLCDLVHGGCAAVPRNSPELAIVAGADTCRFSEYLKDVTVRAFGNDDIFMKLETPDTA